MKFREKFVKYLTEGMSIHIPEDEVFLFYNALEDFINTADNKFIAFYDINDESLVISDIDKDYLRIRYQADKIIFQHADPASMLDTHVDLIIAGQAFLGVIIFIEQLSPSEDTQFILQRQNDQW